MPIDRMRTPISEVRPPPRREAADAAYCLRPKLLQLRELLLQALRSPRTASEPAPLFYFHRSRQAEYEAAKPTPPPWLTAIDALIRDLWPSLVADADVRHAARALDGLLSSARALAATQPVARDLGDLLNALDDELLCVIEPATRTGFLIEVRGLAEIDQAHDLLASLQPRLHRENVGELPERSRFQFFALGGLQSDGSLPAGHGGAAYWLFNEQPASAIPRYDGERVLLLGEPRPTAMRAAAPRFPDLMTEGQILRTLTRVEVEERLARYRGEPIASHEVVRTALRAA